MNIKKRIVPVVLAVSVISSGVALYQPTTVAEAARNQAVMQEKQQQEAKVTNINVLNTMTLQITFNKPLATEDIDPNNLETIKKDFNLSNGLSIVNVPRLKTGAKSTYIVPVTIQEDDVLYTVSYKGQRIKSFKGTDEKIEIRQTEQVSNDTFELESFLEDGVTDYGNIIAAYRASRGDLAFQLNHRSKDGEGEHFEVISSLRDRAVTIKGSNGEQFVAKYVPFTQATDGRQAPKFRLPEGKTLKPGVTYSVSSQWAELKNDTFTARYIAPLNIQSAEAIDNRSIKISLDKNPKNELFAGRTVQLRSNDGSVVQAQYRFSSRSGEVGIFDVTNNDTLKSGATYTVVPTNNWATAHKVTFTIR